MSRLLLVTFASGFAALTYELVWLSVLSTVVGGTTIAASVTLAVFFLGLGIGSASGARVARRVVAPLRVCLLVELGIALSAGAFLLLLGPVRELYRELHASLQHGATVLVAIVLLLPPSTLMGITLPLVAEAFVGKPEELGRKGSLIYASNTLGGATGAALSAFWLIPNFGVPWTCGTAALLNVGAALGLLTVPFKRTPRNGAKKEGARLPVAAVLLAAVSGFLMLTLEVLWTRMLMQVVHQSVYTFGAILLVFLVSLGLGSWLVAHAIRFPSVQRAPRRLIAYVALGAMGAVTWSALILSPLTEGYQQIHSTGGFAAYIGRVLLVSGVTFLPAAVVAGMLFPLALQLAGPSVRGGGSGLGVLGAANTFSAIAGSLIGGFIMVKAPLGLFDGLGWIAAAYGVVAVVALDGSTRQARFLRPAALALGIVAALATFSLSPPVALKKREKVVDFHQGVDGIVVVTKLKGNQRIKINNNYTLGSSRAVRYQRRQAEVPMLLHPTPENVLFIGLGSGLTANAALDHPGVERLTVVELSADIVDLASKHFAKYAEDLYSDQRADIVADDARHYLATHDSSFDVIVGDLFVPWRSGVGNLYSQEHFRVVQSRLRPGGLFAQWLPLYQMSRREVAVVTRTLLSVFGEVSFWRCEFQPDRSILALVARQPGGPVWDPKGVAARVDAYAKRHPWTPSWMRGYGFFELYAGRVRAGDPLFADAPLHTDEYPVITYQAPRTQRHVMAGEATWVSGQDYLALLEELDAREDGLSDGEAKKNKRAGFVFHESTLRRLLKEDPEARRAKREYRALRGAFDEAGR